MNDFKHKEYFDYSIRGARSNNCILINAKNWIANTSNEIIGFNSRGGIARNFITEVLDVNIDNERFVGTLQAGDLVMLTAVASRLYCSHTFEIPVGFDTTDYTDIPVSHVVGKFTDREISFSSLQLLSNFVMLEVVNTVDVGDSGFLKTTDKTKTICQVVKMGPEVKGISVEDTVLIRDNVSTDTILNGLPYKIVSEDAIVGVFKDKDYNKPLKDILALRHEYILMEEYQPENAAGSDTIVNPQYDASEDEGMSRAYSEETYRALLSNAKDIEANDIVYMPRAATEYITCLGTRYYLAINSNFILVCIRGEY